MFWPGAGAYPEILKGGGRNFKPRQLKLFWWNKLFRLYQPMQGFSFQPVRFATFHHRILLIFFILVYLLSRPSVVFCVCSVLQFNATLYLSRTPIVHITKNVKTKHTHTSNQLHPYSSLPLKKSTRATSTSLINLYSGILC